MPLQIPNLDDRTFDQLVREARARIPVHTPEWTNFNDSDPGITLVQLFAFMTENLLYRSNRIPEANRLKFLTLLGLGLQEATPGRGLVVFRNDRGPLECLPLDAGIELRAGKVPFRTRTGVCVLPVTTQVYYKRPLTDLDAATKTRYETLYGPLKEQPGDKLQFYQTMPLEAPETGKPLPEVDLAAGADTVDRSLWVALIAPENVVLDRVRSALSGQTLALGIYPSPETDGRDLPPAAAERAPQDDPGLVFEIAAPDLSFSGPLAPANYRRLQVEYAENVLEAPGIVQIALPTRDARFDFSVWDFDPNEEGTGDYPPLLEDKALAARVITWIRVRLPEAKADKTGETAAQSARIAWVGGNAARVIQAIPVAGERLGVGTGAPDQVYKVANTPVIAPRLPDADSAADAEDTLTLRVQHDTEDRYETWRRTDDLYAALPDDQVYTLDPESGEVRFGDGLHGRRPGLGRTITVSYEYGGGAEGNVAIGTINKSPQLPGGFKVENPLATWGGTAGDTVAEGERRIASFIKHRDRLVTAGDFRDIIRATPGVPVGRVEILPLFNPNTYKPGSANPLFPGAVTALVIPDHPLEQTEPPKPDRLFLDAICRWIEPRRLVTTEIYVRAPEYLRLWVTVGVITLPGYMREIVHRGVEKAIRRYLSPLVGGLPIPDPDTALDSAECPTADADGPGWPLGMEVRTQDLAAAAVRVEGVRYVKSLRLALQMPDGALDEQTEPLRIEGLQLPWLMGVSAREGDAEDPGVFLGEAQPGGKPIPAPVLRKKC